MITYLEATEAVRKHPRGSQYFIDQSRSLYSVQGASIPLTQLTAPLDGTSVYISQGSSQSWRKMQSYAKGIAIYISLLTLTKCILHSSPYFFSLAYTYIDFFFFLGLSNFSRLSWRLPKRLAWRGALRNRILLNRYNSC